MIAAGLTRNKRILLIDKSEKKTNDRTWCFWEAGTGFFEPVVYKRWDRIWFHATGFSKEFGIAPYQYKMIRGLDFYNYCFDAIAQQTGIDIVNGNVSGLSCAGNNIQFAIDGRQHNYRDAVVFNSIWDDAAVKKQDAIHLLQHFKGWIIETPQPFFTPGEATLMDFRTDQSNGTCFVYVLPLSATRALVEYTLFSEKLLHKTDYDKGLANYISTWLKTDEYVIAEEEFGVIPMTSASFPWYVNGIYNIGTAGGQTKASSGYTFQFIQKQSAAIVKQIKDNTLNPQSKPGQSPRRFHFYDAVLLQVLYNHPAAGSHVFTSLFKKNDPQRIFAFLDNETSLQQDIGILKTLPTLSFLKAALRQIFS